LASDNVGTCSWADGLLDGLATADGETSLPHVGVDVGKDVDATILVDVIDAVDLGTALHGHILKPVDNELEGTVGEGGVGRLHVLVVGHELVQNRLLGEFVNLSGVGNLSLVLEGLLIIETLANVQEVGDDAGVAHPSVDSGLHKLSLGLRDLALLVPVIVSILDRGVARIAISSVVVVILTVGGVVAGIAVAPIVAVAVASLWGSSGKRCKKERD